MWASWCVLGYAMGTHWGASSRSVDGAAVLGHLKSSSGLLNDEAALFGGAAAPEPAVECRPSFFSIVIFLPQPPPNLLLGIIFSPNLLPGQPRRAVFFLHLWEMREAAPLCCGSLETVLVVLFGAVLLVAGIWGRITAYSLSCAGPLSENEYLPEK